MKRLPLLSLVTITILCAAACSNEEPAKPSDTPAAEAEPSAPATPAAEGSLPKIPILSGYKYYVGGPVMKKDEYGRFRLHRFDGEVAQPPSRGMIFGAKRDGDQLEYKVWGNGVLLGHHRGVMRGDVYWEEYAEGYRQGKLIARERRTNDDAARVAKIVTEDVDPETGEVIRTRERSESYLPAKIDDELEDDEDESEGDAPDSAPPAEKAGAASEPAERAPANP